MRVELIKHIEPYLKYLNPKNIALKYGTKKIVIAKTIKEMKYIPNPVSILKSPEITI
jgi:hypothetical protein